MTDTREAAEFDFISDAELADLDRAGREYGPGSTFVMIGGARSVAAVVKLTYLRLLRDRFIAPIFEPYVQAHKLSVIMRHQVYMLTTALGGGDRYDGSQLGGKHRGLGITDDIHRRTCMYMITVLHEVLLEAEFNPQHPGAGFDPQAAMDVEIGGWELLDSLRPVIASGAGDGPGEASA